MPVETKVLPVLTSALLAEQAQITTDSLQNLVKSFLRIAEAVIATKEGRTIAYE